MKDGHNEALARAGAQSAQHIAKTQKSIMDGRAHILASRAAIYESLELLRRTAPKRGATAGQARKDGAG